MSAEPGGESGHTESPLNLKEKVKMKRYRLGGILGNIVVDSEDGNWYEAEEVDARVAKLEVELEVERKLKNLALDKACELSAQLTEMRQQVKYTNERLQNRTLKYNDVIDENCQLESALAAVTNERDALRKQLDAAQKRNQILQSLIGEKVPTVPFKTSTRPPEAADEPHEA